MPKFFDLNIAPPYPTAKIVLKFDCAIDVNVLPCGNGFCQYQPSCDLINEEFNIINVEMNI